MKEKTSRMELLAPAGDWEGLKAGVAGGADAFYLGGKLFSARQSAANFDLEELEKIADYLHLRGRKMYVTVNTLIKEDEVESALCFIDDLYQIGVDALIIQDMGLLYLIRRIWPDLEVHASTQMTITDSAGARFLQNLGVHRVVLAREVSLKEMADIYKETKMELEVFVHGALCVSYSGACLFSSLIGGRSGNRGRCAQPCRMSYKLMRTNPCAFIAKSPTGVKIRPEDLSQVQTPGSHLLSPKDLSFLPYLPQLAAAGVRSLKIEGRMKGPEYVGTVVSVYRKALDRMQADPEHYQAEPEELKTLETVFNRGLSPGYLFCDLGPQLMSVNRPSNRGRFLGRVKNYDFKTRRVTVTLEENLAEGDGIEVWVKKGGRLGTIVEDLKIRSKRVKRAESGSEAVFALQKPAQPGDRVFLTSSREIEEQIRQMLRNDYARSRLSCLMEAEVAPGEPLIVTCQDQEGNTVRVESDEQASLAKKRPLTKEGLAEHLTRLGNSPFIVDEFQAEISGEPMLPYGKLHEVRRAVVSELSKKRLKPFKERNRKAEQVQAVSNEAKKRGGGPFRTGQSGLTVYAGDPETLKKALALGIQRLLIGGESYHPGFFWNKKNLEAAVKACRNTGASVIIALPEITREREKDYARAYLEAIKALKPDAVLVGFPGNLQMVWEKTDLPIFLDYSFHSLNSYGVNLLEKMRVNGYTVSPELSQSEIRSLLHNTRLNQEELDLIVFGPTQLMVSQFCPIGAWAGKGVSPQECQRNCRDGRFFLRDRKGFDFPIITDRFCRMHLLNSRDLCLVRELPVLKDKNLNLRLDLRYYSPDVAGEIIKIYAEALSKGDPVQDSVWERIEGITGRKLTRGHFHRGVE